MTAFPSVLSADAALPADQLVRAVRELPVVVATVSADGVISGLMGPALPTAGLSADLVGRPVTTLFHRLPAEPEALRQIRCLGGSFRCDLEGRTFEVHFCPQEHACDSGAAPADDVLVAFDVTDRQRSEQALIDAIRRAEEETRAKAAFLATISHEVRAPLSGVVGMAGHLLDAPLGTEQRRTAEIIREQAQALLAVVNDLLDYSRLETGRLTLESVDFDLDELVEGTVDLLEGTARAKDLTLAWAIGPEVDRRLRGDAGRLRQILGNLLSNAAAFTDRGSITVTVTAEPERAPGFQTLRFTVVDTGVGIPPEEAASLFDRLIRPDGGDMAGVAGLGLAICKNLVSMMGGRIGVDSHPGEGSTFWFTALLARRPEDTERMRRDGRLRGVRVMLVDASESRGRLVRWMENWGLEVVTLPSALSALQALAFAADQGRPFPLVLVDHDLPDMTGRQFVNLTGQVPGLALNRAVLMVPPLAGADNPEARDVLAKPFGQSALFDRLAVLVEAAVADADDPAPDDGAAPVQSCRVLLVEDDQTNQRVAARMLERAGHRVDVAADGAEAVTAVKRLSYDIVLMDLQMPVMNGLEATRAIRALAGSAGQVPIVAMTASTLSPDIEACLAAGMNDYLTKPLTRERLAVVVAHWQARGDAPTGEGSPDLDPGLSRQLVEDLGQMDAAEVYATFLTEGAQRILALGEGAGRRDIAALEREAQALRGSATDLGFTRLAALAASVAEVARTGDQDEAARRVSGLSEALDAARIAIDRHLAATEP
ncbi:MAG TPA: response regulator [Azospirillaceae bacterium]|nr:response regulator [Azospirillaceae bacterium]